MKHHIIYKTTCLVTGKFYYGMHTTENLNDGYQGSGKILLNSIKKHGKANHLTEIIENLNSPAILKAREREIVNDELLSNPLCMNLKRGGEGGGGPWSEESKAKMSASSRGLKKPPRTEEHKAKLGMGRLGKTASDETKAKMSATRKGRKMPPFTPEHIANMKAARQKRKEEGRDLHNLGRKFIRTT